ncbi:MAG: phosphopantothenoylcysteine decarboxylase [bacterium]
MKKKKKIKVLVTAGPTREYLDPVRYISNDSSGQMGFAIAKAAGELGCDVTLVAGPVSLDTPARVRRIDVVTAREMRREVMRRAAKADIIIMAAAVADWRPRRVSKQKIKRSKGHPHPIPLPSRERGLTIALVENPDILAELGKTKKPGQTLVGFALETGNLERNARVKLKHKRCDWIVANSAAAIGARQSRAMLLAADGRRIALPRLAKEDLAVVILSHILS